MGAIEPLRSSWCRLDQAGLRIGLAMRRDQLDKRKAYMETLPRIDIGEDAA